MTVPSALPADAFYSDATEVLAIADGPEPSDSNMPRAMWDTLFDIELRMRQAHETHLGYPYNLSFAPRVPQSLGRYLINNLGDADTGMRYGSEVNAQEREVIEWVARAWGASNLDDFAGSIVTSGTEGNIWGLYLGREALPDAVLVHGADAHASIPWAARLLRIESRVVDSTERGDIDLFRLAETLESLNGRKVILALTCGTPLKGAHDDLAGAIAVMDAVGHGPQDRYVHVDGALNAMVLPFLPEAPRAVTPSFALAIDSIVTSGHKMIGTPMPCGVLVSRRAHMERVTRAGGEAQGWDATLMGSRSGHAVLAIWTRLMARGVAGFARDARRCVMRAEELAATLAEAGVPVLLNPMSLTVVFPEPPEALARTYQLPCHRGLAHAIIMPSVTDRLIERFAEDYGRWFRAAGPR